MVSAAAAIYNYDTNAFGNKKVTTFLAGTGILTMSAASLKSYIDNDQAKKLRAYYSHTSNY